MLTSFAFFAEFSNPHMLGVLRISFKKAEIYRVVDSLAMLDVETTPIDGKVETYHFGYTVENAAFALQFGEKIFASEKPMTHYRFITGDSCLDVITSSPIHMRVHDRET
jgi:hypothetical protein